MSLILFNQLQTPSVLEEQPLILRNKREQCFEDAFESCECNHLDTGHSLLIGKCGYQNCLCLKFKSKEIKLVVFVTHADIFEYENPNHSPTDSLQWWDEIENWMKNYDC